MATTIYSPNGGTLKVVKPSRRELGTTGRSLSSLFQYYLSTDEYLSTLTYPLDIPIYNKMARSDAQIKAILLMLGLPIRATQWFVKPKDDSPQANKNAEFIHNALFGGFKDGLQLGFDDFIRNVCTMFQYGHSIFEKVFEVGKDGYYKWKKFAVRPQSTISEFLYDRSGDCSGLKQWIVHEGWKEQKINIKKLLVFSHDMQQGDIRGVSVLRSAYKHWVIKDFLYKIVNVGVERNLVGTPVLKLPENYTQEDKDLADEIVTNLRSSELGGVRMPETFDLEMFEGKRTLIDVLPYIEYQDQLISRSILAQFMNLGSGGSGSFALSSDQSQLFLMMLDSSAKNIANIINTHAIPELIGYNFSSDLYPTLTFKPMNSTKLVNTLKTLTDGKMILPDDDLEGYLRDMLDLPDQEKSREEYQMQFIKQQNQFKQEQAGTDGKDSKDGKPNDADNKGINKSKTPIENNSQQASYKDKIKDDNVNSTKMSELELDLNNLTTDHNLRLNEIIKKQLQGLHNKALNEDINSLSTIKVQFKRELNNLISEIVKNQLKLNESDILFKAKSNIISNSISEKVKSEFLKTYISYDNIDIDNLTQNIIENL